MLVILNQPIHAITSFTNELDSIGAVTPNLIPVTNLVLTDLRQSITITCSVPNEIIVATTDETNIPGYHTLKLSELDHYYFMEFLTNYM